MTIKESLDELKALSGELNKESDSLSEFLEAIDDRLRDSKIGVSTWMEELLLEESSVDAGTGLETIRGWELGYGKHGDLWRLLVRKVSRTYEPGNDGGDGAILKEEQPLPLLNSPRGVRVHAALQLQDLLESIVETMRARVGDVRVAREKVELILKSYQTT